MLLNKKDFFVVDATWLVKGITQNTPPPNWIVNFMDNPKAYKETLEKLHQCALKFPKIAFFPTHDETLYD